MRIAVQVVVEMTPEQAETYCYLNCIDRDEIREDVRSYVRTALQGSPAFIEGGADVYVKD